MKKISTIEKCRRAVTSLFNRCTDKMFGRKFYIVVVGQKGAGLYFVNSTIYRTPQQADAYKESLAGNGSFMYIGTYSFRSKNDFILTIAQSDN